MKAGKRAKAPTYVMLRTSLIIGRPLSLFSRLFRSFLSPREILKEGKRKKTQKTSLFVCGSCRRDFGQTREGSATRNGRAQPRARRVLHSLQDAGGYADARTTEAPHAPSWNEGKEDLGLRGGVVGISR